MKCFFLFLFGAFFGFFDFVYFLVFLAILIVMGFFDYYFFFFGGIFFCDSLSFFLFFLTMLVLFFCFFSSLIDNWVSNFFKMYSFIIISLFFLLYLCFFSYSVFVFYICFELIFMFMFILLLSWGNNFERLQASFYMVFYTIVVSFPFLVYLVWSDLGGFSLKFLFFYEISSYYWYFVFFVFLVKLPVYGVHLWLPKAHVEAPVFGSMVLAGVLLKLGGYGVLRLSFYFLAYFSKYSGYFVAIGLSGGLFSCFLCLRQSDLKAFVAYSSVCHMGFALGGFYSSSFLGFGGSVFMFISHGFCSSCLFYILYIFYERYHSRSLYLLKGVGFLFPLMMLFWFIFSSLNMGVPPSFSFFSEISMVSGLLQSNLYLSFFVGLLLFFSGLYCIFLYVVSCHGGALIEGVSQNFTPRELLVIYGHFFPLIFVPLYMSEFFL